MRIYVAAATNVNLNINVYIHPILTMLHFLPHPAPAFTLPHNNLKISVDQKSKNFFLQTPGCSWGS